MSREISKDCHPFIYKNEIRKIAKPLFDNTNITGISYTRFYPDNTAINLSTCPELFAESYRLKMISVYERQLQLAESRNVDRFSGQCLSILEKDCSPVYALLMRHGFKVAIGMIDVYTDYLEYHAFFSKQNWVFRSYIEEIKSLIRFKHLFLHETEKLIAKIPISNRIDLSNQQGIPLRTPLKIYCGIEPKRFYVKNYDEHKVRITAKELLCLKALAQGRTHKEIARLLDVSLPTVQSCQIRLMHKLAVTVKSQLIDIYWRNDLSML